VKRPVTPFVVVVVSGLPRVPFFGVDLCVTHRLLHCMSQPPFMEAIMTTEAAAALYLAQHNFVLQGRECGVYNPKHKQLDELPIIYGSSFCSEGGDRAYYALAEDGTCLGSHWCSAEGYAPADLGCLDGTRPDRHEDYKKHYPDGYRMEFVRSSDFHHHIGAQKALAANQAKVPVA
jgi:hypothetical protein